MPVAISNNNIKRRKQSREYSSSKPELADLQTDVVCLRQRQRPASLIFLLTGIPIHDTVAVVRPRLRLQHLGQPFSLGVGVVPEVEEKEQENQAVQADDVDEYGELVGAIRNEEILGDVAGHHNKLYLGGATETGEAVSTGAFRGAVEQKRTTRVQDVPAGWW